MIVSVLLFLLSVGLMTAASRQPEFAQWYSVHIYPFLVATLGRVSGWLPFSVSELGIYILLLAFIVTLVRMLWMVIRVRKDRRPDPEGETDAGKSGTAAHTPQTSQTLIAAWLSGVLLAAGILVFLYVVCCGINYHRRAFSEEEGIVTYKYSTDELQEICLWLTDEINARADKVSRDADGVMEIDSPVQSGAVEAMLRLAEDFPSLSGYYPKPKELMISAVLSYQGLTGIYLPFTVEANYNSDMTAYNKPFTACHELSHLRGFMREQEANFIAFLACISSEREDFQYSGYLSGWVYCMNVLYRTDYEGWQEIRVLLDEDAEPDLTANDAFWDSHEGMISETSERINDTYLRVNGQADGVQSYDRMVDLIAAYFGETPQIEK